MNFLFKILKGMFTPYIEPPKKARIEPTINEPIQLDDQPKVKQVSAKFFDGSRVGGE